MAAKSILVIDDDTDLCLVLSRFLEKKGFVVSTASSGEKGLELLRAHSVDLVLCDYRMPDMMGLEALQKIKVINNAIPVIMITGYSDVRTAVETFKYGAADYITKPLFPDELLITINETLNKQTTSTPEFAVPLPTEVAKKTTVIQKESPTEKPPRFIEGTSDYAKKMAEHIAIVAPTELSVIINGETGSGKEFIAQSIHQQSNRAHAPFVALDCGALPKELAGSELFGHVKGSFTGAIADKPGSFEQAHTGTIFLDEVGNLTYDNQIKLLRVIQERRIKRIGATKDVAIDVRIIAATNEDLTTAFKKGTFREDLYHRLNEFKLELLPLRHRKDDILNFANHFLKLANHAQNKNVSGFSAQVQEIFLKYPWFGNLREMHNVIRRCVLLTQGDLILAETLPPDVMAEIAVNPLSEENEGVLKSAVMNAEKQTILDALASCGNNKSKAARNLNIDRKTLYNKLRQYDIDA